MFVLSVFNSREPSVKRQFSPFLNHGKTLAVFKLNIYDITLLSRQRRRKSRFPPRRCDGTDF